MHILCSITSPPPIAQFMRYAEEYYGAGLDRPQMTMWRMCIAYWIPKTTNTHSEYVLLATATLVVQTHLGVICCMTLPSTPGLH